MAQGSARLDASTEYIRRTANLPSSQNVTVGGWFRLNAWQAIDFNTLISLRGSSYLMLRFDSGGAQFLIASNGDFTAFTAKPTTGSWFYAAVAANATNAVFRWWNSSGTLQETVTGTAAASFTGSELTIGNDDSGNSTRWADIWTAQVRVWDDVLTQGELESELASSSPVITTNLNTAFEDDPATDVSGNSRPWSTSGITVTDAYYPGNYGTSIVPRSMLLGVG